MNYARRQQYRRLSRAGRAAAGSVVAALLALIFAALGRKEDAIRKGRRAVELLPISNDAYDGPIIATNLAAIYVQLGERELALQQLTSLVEVPNGPTPGTLRVEPEWDPLRGDPRFEKLAAGRE